ncbi:MAG TPA: hypothetical protein VGW75_04320 [Solirubrobacteraceae bacterium]|jgi:hypothetical protein|nr:hypothetical protein [Solirubrobacteraceae bacterium]
MPSLVTPARAGAGALFGSLARVLGTRPLHPTGVAFRATLTVEEGGLPGTRLFGGAAVWDARVRFSRGFGLPEPLPEIMSVAVKVPDAYGAGRDQDLLLTATGRRPLARHLVVPATSHLDRFYSSVLPFRAGDATVLFGAARRGAGRPGGAGDLDELVAAAAAVRLSFDLLAAAPRAPWRTIGRLDVGALIEAGEEDELAFNSDHCGGGIAPAGAINRIRGGAYAAAARARRGGASASARRAEPFRVPSR